MLMYFHVFSYISMYFHVCSDICCEYLDVFSCISVWNPIALAWQSGKTNILRQGPAHVWTCMTLIDGQKV